MPFGWGCRYIWLYLSCMDLRHYCHNTLCSVTCCGKVLQLTVAHLQTLLKKEMKIRHWWHMVHQLLCGLNLCFKGGTGHPKLTCQSWRDISRMSLLLVQSLKWLSLSFRHLTPIYYDVISEFFNIWTWWVLWRTPRVHGKWKIEWF